MAQLILSRRDILDDITAYQARIKDARDRLAVLPVQKYSTRKDKAIVRVLGSEIDHVFRMVGYAKAALARLEKGDST